jgi:hypothetical protein
MVNSPYVVNKHQNTFIREMLFQQGLGLVGNRLEHRDEAPHCHVSPRHEGGTQRSRSPHAEKSPRHHNSPCVETEADDPGLCHHDTTIAQGTKEEVDDPDPRDIHMITKTTKLRWGHRVSLVEFAEHRYPKDSSYPMTSRSMMGHRNHSHSYQIICKQ